MRRVLIICYDFPPRRSSAIYRATGLTKHLPSFGWQPTILTIQGSDDDVKDDTLLDRIPAGIRVHRTDHWNLGAWEATAARAVRSAGGLRPLSAEKEPGVLDRILRRSARLMRSVLYFPDETVGWVPIALTKAIELLMADRYHIVYTTSPPRSTPLVGWTLRQVFNVPWVAEFRDPWLFPPDVRALLGSEPPTLRHQVETRLNASLFNRADGVVTVTEGYAEELERLHGVPSSKLAVVSNGFDEDDFKSAPSSAASLLEPGCIHLTHFGTVYPYFSGRFFPALENFLHENPDAKHRFRINIIGFPDNDVREYSLRTSLKDVVRIRGFIKHAEALQTMLQSNYLLLFYAHRHISRVCIPGKIYEYLRTGRPILTTTFEGGLKKLVEMSNSGWAVPPEDTEAIKQVLRTILQNPRVIDHAPPALPEFVEQFRYDRLAEKLAGVFDSVIRHGS